jgi:DNA-binding NarL/FixJ family response regulator
MVKEKKESVKKVVLVSLPGMLQVVLHQIITSRSDAEIVGIASGGLSAIHLIQRQQPDLVVIDSNVPESEATSLILWIKRGNPGTRCLVLAQTSHFLMHADRIGADFAVQSYTLPDSLNKVFENL